MCDEYYDYYFYYNRVWNIKVGHPGYMYCVAHDAWLTCATHLHPYMVSDNFSTPLFIQVTRTLSHTLSCVNHFFPIHVTS